MLGWAWLDGNWVIAVYSLSFWHYFLYWLAYQFGAVPPRDFRRDAILWKTIALVALGSDYLAAPLDLVSLSVVAAGFLLNSLAARALGNERTYYGYELMDLPPAKIIAFPYSWVSHPMLVGNMAAFGGTLLNAEFRREWWPLAVAHVVLNLGLLMMELAVKPERRNVHHRDSAGADSNSRLIRTSDALFAFAIPFIAGFVAWRLQSPHFLVDAAAASSIAIYARALFHRYTAAPAAPFERHDVPAQQTVPETIE
jgi:phospholipid methyltransferase